MYYFFLAATDKESSNLMGVFLHGIVSAIITTPLGACGAIAVDRKLDPTYLWFRNLTIISSRLKLILQLIVIFPMVLHASILIFGFGVIGVNIILLILEVLEREPYQNSRHSWKYVINMQTYLQLVIITQVMNTIIWYFLPVFTLILVVFTIVMGYMILKMAGSIPYALIILDAMLSALILWFIMLAFPVVADVMMKSADFLRNLELHGVSNYRKRQLRSCRQLKICAGSYFCIHKSTGITLLDLIAYYTMSAIISV